jgi:hypothetical protein
MKYASAVCCEPISFGFVPGIACTCTWPASLKNNQQMYQIEANRHNFLTCGQSLRYHLDRLPPLQANAPKFPVLISPLIFSYLRFRMFEASFLTAMSSRRGMRAGVAQIELISPVLFSFMSTSYHILASRLVVPLRGQYGYHSYAQ